MIRQRRQQIQRQRISPKLRMTLLSSGFFALAAFALIIYSSTGLHLEVIAGQGMQGEKITSQGQEILNEFTALTADVKAGSTQINVADNTLNSHGRFAGSLKPGELVMILQMQNGGKQYVDLNEEIGTVDEAGKYEFAEVAGVEDGPKINFTASLKNSYDAGSKTQLVRVPRFTSLIVPKGSTITTDTWDGNTGGIVAIEVKGNATINGVVDATAKGFNARGFQKLLKTAAEARRMITSADSGGSRIYFGAGSINRVVKTQSNGGGIVYMIVSGTISGNGTISADGGGVELPGGEIQANGGQGGSIYICAGQTRNGITITANGGNALQLDSMQLAKMTINSEMISTVRGQGGEGGIIRTSDQHSFKSIADGGLHATFMMNVDGNVKKDSAKAVSGIISVADLQPYSKNPSIPTKLEYFAATSMSGSVKVSWVTVSEFNVDFFTVERSIDGSDFIPLFKIDGKGNTSGKSSYEFDDAAQSATDCQYRLTQTSNDNHTEIYPAVKLKQPGKATETKLISVQPNPVGDHFTIQCMISEPGIIEISITDISGNVIRKETAVTGEGLNTISVNNFSDIPKGTYFLSLLSGNQKMQTVKILK